jgi:hypothetical protein
MKQEAAEVVSWYTQPLLHCKLLILGSPPEVPRSPPNVRTCPSPKFLESLKPESNLSTPQVERSSLRIKLPQWSPVDQGLRGYGKFSLIRLVCGLSRTKRFDV